MLILQDLRLDDVVLPSPPDPAESLCAYI